LIAKSVHSETDIATLSKSLSMLGKAITLGNNNSWNADLKPLENSMMKKLL